MAKIRLGLSSCLRGESVRYDGGHRWDPFITETLGQYLEFVPVCPEVEAGLSVPREPMRLVGEPQAPRLLTVHTGQDLTPRLLKWSRRRVQELARENLDGFIFKSKSPSCGPGRVKLHRDRGRPRAVAAGLFAGIFREQCPLLPVTDEGRLHDPESRENFIERLFFCRRWREFLGQRPEWRDLAAFHRWHQLQIQAHSREHCRRLDRLVAGAQETDLPEAMAAYQELVLAALGLKATTRKNAGVLLNLAAEVKKRAGAGAGQELLESIEAYRRGEAPRLVPLTLINHYLRHYREPSREGQTYLNPHPLELLLRNHA